MITKLEKLQKRADELELKYTDETSIVDLQAMIDEAEEKADEAKLTDDETEDDKKVSKDSIAKLIENEKATDSKEKKALRQTLRDYIKQNPDKAEADKEGLMKQLNALK